MELKPILNNNGEIEYFEHVEDNGTLKKEVIVIPTCDSFHVSETIEHNHNEIYKNDFIIDTELLEGIRNIEKYNV